MGGMTNKYQLGIHEDDRHRNDDKHHNLFLLHSESLEILAGSSWVLALSSIIAVGSQ